MIAAWGLKHVLDECLHVVFWFVHLLKIEYSVESIIYFPKNIHGFCNVSGDSLGTRHNGWSFLPRIEIMISLLFHVLNNSKVLGCTTFATTPT